MDQPVVTPWTVTSRRLSRTGTSSTALASLQSHGISARRRQEPTSIFVKGDIFAKGDSLEQEVNKQVEGEENLTHLRKCLVENELEIARKGIPEAEQREFDEWATELKDRLETGKHPDWNYFHPGNQKIIRENIANIWVKHSEHHQQLVSHFAHHFRFR